MITGIGNCGPGQHFSAAVPSAMSPRLFQLRKGFEGKKQCEKSQSNQEDPDRVQRIPPAPLDFPVLRKTGNIPGFDPVIDRYRADDTEHDDNDPEKDGENEKHSVVSRPRHVSQSSRRWSSNVTAIQIGMILPKNRANTWMAGRKARSSMRDNDG